VSSTSWKVIKFFKKLRFEVISPEIEVLNI